jgi:hypothetical protein
MHGGIAVAPDRPLGFYDRDKPVKNAKGIDGRHRSILGLHGMRHAGGHVMHPALRLSLLLVSLAGHPVLAAPAAPSLADPPATLAVAGSAAVSSTAVSLGKHADFMQENASDDVHRLADWIIDSNDHHDLPFLIVDKKNAKSFVFDGAGHIKGAAPVLLGMATGDDSAPGIGQRKLSAIAPNERTTPAGRFSASVSRNLHGDEILWVDYDAAISLHRVITSNPKERRAERLASPAIGDNRISFGCINVPVIFYEQVVSPAFTKANGIGIVYVLPESRSMHDTFGLYDVDQHAREHPLPASAQPAAPLPVEHIIRLR